VLITALITGVAAYYIFGIHFIVALLLGATLASECTSVTASRRPR
jgi:NhaP-type Na+/H+ and K+/H+ antiporter